MKTVHSFKSIKGKNWTCYSIAAKSLNKTQNISVKLRAGALELSEVFQLTSEAFTFWRHSVRLQMDTWVMLLSGV